MGYYYLRRHSNGQLLCKLTISGLLRRNEGVPDTAQIRILSFCGSKFFYRSL